MSDVLYKRCTGQCGRELPATPEYFHRDKRGKYGLVANCKVCVSEKTKEYRSRPSIKEHRNTLQKAYYEMHKDEIRAKNRVYNRRTDIKDHKRRYRKEYRSRSEIQERERTYHKARYSRPEIREHHRIYGENYRSRPEAQELKRNRMKAYSSRPEVRMRRRETEKVRRTRTEVRMRNIACQKAWRESPEGREYLRVYRNSTDVREAARTRVTARRAKKRSVQGTHTPDQIKNKLRLQKHKCYYCQKRLQKVKGKYIYHIEHTFPLSRVAGTDIPANSIDYLVLACPSCNLSKGDKFPWEFAEGGRLL